MGYMGLDHYNDSDEASDFVANVVETIGKMGLKELKNKSNCYNTSGEVNVALFAEAFLKDIPVYSDSSLYKALQKSRDMLIKQIEKAKEAKEWEDKDMHIKAYKRMRNFLTIKINEAY